MEFLKKMSIGTYVLAGGCVLTLGGLIVALISCSPEGFAISPMPMIVLFSILAMASIAGAVALAIMKGDSPFSTILVLAAIIFLSFAIFNLIDGKQDVLGTVMFSDLEKGFAPAEFACYVGVAGIIIYMVAAVATAVGAFMKLSKD